MPRSGVNGTYSLPGAQATQVPGTPIPSAVNNQGWSDVEQTFNTPTPIAYGGTNASNAPDALTNLGIPSNFVGIAAQSFTAAQQGQARANIGAGVLAGFRNKLINGDVPVWQRGTSFNIGAGASAYTADRMLVANNTNQTVTVTQYAMSPTDRANVAGCEAEFGIKLTFAVAPSTGSVTVRQHVENVRTLAGKLVTLTAYTASNMAALPDSEFWLSQYFGSGGSSAASYAGATTAVASGSFTKKQQLITLGDTLGKTIGAGNYLQTNFTFIPRNSGDIWIAHMSLVEGDATVETDPFSPRHVQQELALCHRYYQASTVRLSISMTPVYGNAEWLTIPVSLPVEMRTTPTITGGSYSDTNTDMSPGVFGTNILLSFAALDSKTIRLTLGGTVTNPTSGTYCYASRAYVLDSEI